MNTGFRNFILSAVFSLGLLVLIGQVGWWRLLNVRPKVSSETCPKGHLAVKESCEGKSEPGWQNSGSYYLIAKGKPRVEFCSSFIENYKQLDSETGTTCSTWAEVSCRTYPGLGSWRCFACDRIAANGNTHYYLFAATSSDCSQGIYFSGSRYKPEDLADKIGFSK